MRKRVWIAIVVVAVVLAGIIGWQVAQPGEPEPVYMGRTLTSWLEGYYSFHSPEPKQNPKAVTAVREIGTNAIPTLLRLLRANDSPLKTTVMDLLKRQHFIKVDYTSAVTRNDMAVYGFIELGTNAQSAVPALIQIADKNVSPSSRLHAIGSLGLIGPPAKQAVPYLLQWATNGDLFVRQSAVVALGRIGPSAKEGVPSLLQWATNANINLRSSAKRALQQIDPEAAAKASVK